MTSFPNKPLDTCPFIDDENPHCAPKMTLQNIRQAYTVCVGGYRGCETYWRMNRSQPRRAAALAPLTLHGRPLLPTGT